MAEGLLARAYKVVEAGVGSVVETAERLTGPALMRQAVRDAEHAVDDARRQQDRARCRAATAAEVARLADERAATLANEARYAVGLGRDGLATAALSQKRAATTEAEDARAAEQAAAAEAARLAEAVVELAARQRALAEELRAHERTSRDPGKPVPLAVDRKITRAEQSFARAASAIGGSTVDRGAVIGVDEIDRVRRERAVADELAQLKAEAGIASTPARRARKS